MDLSHSKYSLACGKAIFFNNNLFLKSIKAVYSSYTELVLLVTDVLILIIYKNCRNYRGKHVEIKY